MAERLPTDEQMAEELLAVLRDDETETPADLPDKTIRKVQALITTRDIIDLSTYVFLLRFCAPLIDLLVAMFGRDLPTQDRRLEDE
jgi:hypothetical protein